jgi:uncharacterized protein YndB with AHSA1/START domain
MTLSIRAKRRNYRMTEARSNDGPLELRTSRTFGADQNSVFKAWTDPDLLKQWFGPPGVTCEVAEIELRVGGHYHIEMKTPEGNIIKLNGVFKVVTPPSALEYTWQWEEMDSKESFVKVQFNQSDSGTVVILEHSEFSSEESKEGHVQGWRGSMDRLSVLIKAGQG